MPRPPAVPTRRQWEMRRKQPARLLRRVLPIPSRDAAAASHYPIRHNGGYMALAYDGSVKFHQLSQLTDAMFHADVGP